MSASNPNSAIYVTDTPKQIKLKVHLQTNEWLEFGKKGCYINIT
jgi:tryptophanyl-tRNA synthetase